MKYLSISTLLLALGLPVLADISVDKTVTMMQEQHTINETKELLLQKAKREAAGEIFGDFITSSTLVDNGKLSNDSIIALVMGKVHVKGTPTYVNGDNLGEIKISLTAYATDSDIAQAKKVLDQRIAALQKAESENPEIVSSTFKSLLKTNKGGKQDIFYEGEEIEPYVLLNRPGYYYLIGKINIKGKTLSYLVDLDNSTGVDKFVRYVNGQNTNKWMSLGAFIVEPPFGTENLQLVASTTEIKSLPKHHYDEQYGYYFIDNILAEAGTTRGIKKKNISEAIISKSDLQFTTIQK